MGFFSDLQSGEHPLLIRYILALLGSFVLVLGWVLTFSLLTGARGISTSIFLLPLFMAPVILLGLDMKKAGGLSPAILGFVPLVVVLQCVNYLVYAGVISLLLSGIIALVWVLATAFVQARTKSLKLAIYAAVTAVIIIFTFLSLPKYTCAKAKAIIASELEIQTDQLGLVFPFDLGCSRPSVFVDSGYLIGAEMEGALTTYLFDPISGQWGEIYRPRIGEPQEQLDPTTQRWLDSLKEQGIELD